MSSEYHLLFVPDMGRWSAVSVEVAVCVVILCIVFGFWLAPGGLAWALAKSRGRFAIPGPPGFPLTGLLHVFSGSEAHRVLAKLARRWDAAGLMAFSVGFTRFVISSEPDTAKEVLSSSAFADRPVKESAYELLFHRAMGFAPYGEYWRNLRRISATHLFSPRRIAGFEGFRRGICLKMVDEMRGLMAENGEVEVKKVLHFGSLNNVMMTVFGRSYDFKEGGDGFELEKMVSEGYDLLGSFNWSDHFPLLGFLDLQGVRKRCRRLVSKVNVFVGKIIEEHRAKMAAGDGVSGNGVGDFVHVLLDLEKEDKLTDSDMIAVLWVSLLSSSFPPFHNLLFK